jgi:hypothetical protein
MRHSVRLGSTALGLAFASLTAWATFGTAACVVTTSDTTDAAGDDSGADTYVPVETSPGNGSIRVKASTLVGSAAADVTAFGGGSTYADLIASKIAYAKATVTSTSTPFPTEIGVDASGNAVDGVLTNVVPGTYSILVKGYLRGVIADLAATPDTAIIIAQTTCNATVAADTETIATCTPLSLTDASGNTYIKGIIFPSDFLGASGGAAYASTTSGATMDVWRARTPTSGSAAASVTESDPRGVIFIDEAKFASTESTSARETQWSLSVELKDPPAGTGDACTTAPGCKVTRKDASGAALDLVFVNPASGDHANCIISTGTTGTNKCFQ